MASFPLEIWAAIGAVAGTALLVWLHVLASLYREQTAAHDLKLRVQRLRRQYARRMAELQTIEWVDVVEPAGRIGSAAGTAGEPKVAA